MEPNDAKTGAIPALRYCLYARKSTEEEDRQALSIDSQIKEMLSLAEREGLDVAETRRESHSAKDSGQRPEYNRLITDIRSGKLNAILTWSPDRLSRNAGDLGAFVDLMDQGKLVEIRTFGQKFTNSPNEKFLLMILGSQAKLENDNKSVNVKRGLRTRIEMGLWPGRAPTGYLNEMRTDRKGYVMPDPKRASIIKKMFEKVAEENWSGRMLFAWLMEIGFTTKYGKPLSLANIYLILENHFYYGMLEYPKKSDKWYQGRHLPLISKELFDLVRSRIKRDGIQRSETKEFAFTRLMVCGACGSGVCAEEKFRKKKDYTTARYVYYGCTRSKDKNCKNGYIREEEVIQQLAALIDDLSLDELGVRAAIEREVERYRRFRRIALGKKMETAADKDVDAKNYVKYLLKEGSTIEKRELLGHLRNRLVLDGKKIRLQ